MADWIAGAAFRGTINIYDGTRQVAVVGTSIAPDEARVKRDAALIAAAPAAFAALRAVNADARPTNWDDDDDPAQVAAWRALDAALSQLEA